MSELEEEESQLHSPDSMWELTPWSRQAKSSTSTAYPTQVTPTQNFFSDPEVVLYVDEIVEMTIAMRNASSRRTTVVDAAKQMGDLMPNKEISPLVELRLESKERIEASILLCAG
ncbi:hypothetical protein vseg_010832 [Gypsophila vaccaria]